MNSCHALKGALAVWVLLLAPACRHTAEGVKEDSRQAEEEAKILARKISAEAKETGTKVGGVAKEVGDKVTEGAREVGDKVKTGAREAAAGAEAAKQTVDVKAHLVAARNIDASQIDVETDTKRKTVTLTGSVPTPGQRAAAEKLARQSAGGYKIRNLLTVASK